jgi:glycerol-3-phosphate acyltransferase PlsY
LVGAIPFGLWVGKIFYKKDIRKFGSGNIGTTNTFRVLGKRAGITVLLLDMFKGTFAVLLPAIFGATTITPLIFGVAAVVGHTFSIYEKFKGGKAVATSGGVMIGFNPPFSVFVIGVFLIVFFLTSMVSAGSVAAAISGYIGIIFFPMFHFFVYPKFNLLFTILVFIMATIIIVRHKENMKRILAGNESTVGFGLHLLDKNK